MNLLKLIEFLRNHLKAVVWICVGVLLCLVILDAIPAIVDKGLAHTPIEHFPGFWAGFGFVGCAAIILISKWFGHAGIMKREDYYDRQPPVGPGGGK